MTRAAFCAVVTLLSVCSRPGASAEVSGKIILQKKLKRAVAPTVYNLRGATLATLERRAPDRHASPFDRVAVWLYAVIVVVPTRWAAQPAADGSFEWPDVPPGKYWVTAWQRFGGLYHRKLAVQDAPLRVSVTIPEQEPDKP